MSGTIPVRTGSIPAPYELARMSNDDLRRQLGHAITMTAESIAYLAAIWVELERRGEDMSGLRISLAPFLHDVASGRLAPEAVLTFAGHKMMLRWVARRPIPEQLALAAGKPVTIVDGSGARRQVRPIDLNIMDLRLIETRPETVEIDSVEIKEPATPEISPEVTPSKKRPPKVVTIPVSDAEYAEIIAEALRENLSIANLLRGKIGLARRHKGRRK